MASENETVYAIKKRMLKWADEDIHEVGRDVLRRQAQQFASDLESAWRREKDGLVRNLDALEKAMERVCSRDVVSEISTIKKEIQDEGK